MRNRIVKSGKQRRAEIRAKRLARAKKLATSPPDPFGPPTPEAIPVDVSQLAPTNSYSVPFFYVDRAFVCRDCGIEQIWTAKQQKWWYEVAKGNIDSTAVRCRPCRKIQQEIKAEARRVHLEGVARKQALLDQDDPGFAVSGSGTRPASDEPQTDID